MSRISSLRPSPSVMRSARSDLLWKLSPPIVKAIGKAAFSLRVEVLAPLPKPPYVVAANHYSHFDPPVVGAVISQPMRFLALSDLFGSSKLLDWLMEGYGAIPTPRVPVPIGTVRSALEALDEGLPVAIFPEATRVSHWGVLPPKRGAAWIARRADVPLVPVAVLGTGRAFDLDGAIQRSPIRLVIGETLEHADSDQVTMERWADWIGKQVERYPELEPDGPRRAFHDFADPQAPESVTD